MHVIETYFECGGFDHELIQGGTSIYLWNIARHMARAGHRVSIVAPAHGRLDDVKRTADLEQLPYHDSYELPLALDPRTWRDLPEQVSIPLTTTAYRARLEGVDLYFLSNDVLDSFPDSFYPPYESKGVDLLFYKSVAYQVDTIRFIRWCFGDEPAVIHAHEPYYHYLLPAAFEADPTKRVVSTIQSNMPITKSEYRPLVERLFEFLDVSVELPAPDPSPASDLLPLIQYQQRTHLHYAYPQDHVRIFDLVADHADRIAFLSDGHRRFYTDFADSPFERLFTELPVADTVRRNVGKQFVGGCAIGERWTADPPSADRSATLASLGMDPRLPTFYHNARYALHHKGQVELIRAIGRVLDEGIGANFIVRCLSDSGIDVPLFHEVAGKYPDKMHLEWSRVSEERIGSYTASADFCLFPSKFEMDTFLIAMGEAMACGAVPIATAQEGMSHFGHVRDPLSAVHSTSATGWAINRSFAEDDPLLVDALAQRIRDAVGLFADDPRAYRTLSANSSAVARTFTWSHCAERHLEQFATLWDAGPPTMVAEPARSRPADVERAFDAAWERVDIPRCLEIAQDRADLVRRIDARVSVHGRHLTYRMPHAVRAEAVLAGHPTDQRAAAVVVAMTRGVDGFVADLPDGPATAVWIIVTLESGRTAWDLVAHV